MAKFVIHSSPGCKVPNRRRSPHDARHLFCCMDVLQIDHNKLAQDEPLFIASCRVFVRCAPTSGIVHWIFAADLLACAGTSGGCNSAMLTTIAALQKCRHPPHYSSASAFSRIQPAKA